MDMTVDQRAAKMVEDALALLGPKGESWTTGAMERNTTGGVQFCSVGAMRRVAFGDVRNPMILHREHRNYAVYERAMDALAQAFYPNNPGKPNDPWVAEGYVVRANDIHSGSAFSKINNAFAAAIKKLKS